MTDFFWPSTLIPARSSITLRDLSSRFVSPFTGTSLTYSRPGGDLLQMRIDLPPLTAAKGAALRGIVSKLRGGVHRVWCKDHSYVRRGSFPATELLANNAFTDGASSWAQSQVTLTAADGIGSLQKDPALGGSINQSIAIVSGAYYAARFICVSVIGSLGGVENRVGSSASASTYLAGSSLTGSGYKNEAWTAAVTSAYYSLTAPSVSTAGDRVDVLYTSVARCALVAGASQTGSTINVDQLPASTNGLLLPGDQVQIGEELFIVAAPLNSTGSGVGTLVLHRPVRTSPADNAPVIIHEPMGLFMLAENENGWENVPGRFTNASVSLIEAVR